MCDVREECGNGVKLNFLLIHGIGQQKKQDQDRFLDRICKATTACLRKNGKLPEYSRRQAATAEQPLNAVRADWSNIYYKQKETWLDVMFPNLKSALRLSWEIFLSVVLIVTVLRLTVGGGKKVFDELTGYCATLVSRPGICTEVYDFLAMGWESILMVILGALALWFIVYRFIPWGHIFSLARGFEARTLSDVLIYCGRKGEQEIVYEVCKCLLKMHVDPLRFLLYIEDPDGYSFPRPEDRPRLILGGHSQGTVIAYDMLQGSTSYLKWDPRSKDDRKKPSMRRRLDRLDATLDKAELLNSVRQLVGSEFRKLQHCDTDETLTFTAAKTAYGLSWDEGEYFYYRLLEFLNMSFAPVGMVTFGAPVPVFMFRNPDQFKDHGRNPEKLALWKNVCPPGFHEDGTWQGITWRWQNFWHSADFVAHRMESLFNDDFPVADGGTPIQFVTDVKRNTRVHHPIEAHSSYWTNPKVINAIADQLAATISEMD